jgi:quinoprotein glucose dehydrogenase
MSSGMQRLWSPTSAKYLAFFLLALGLITCESSPTAPRYPDRAITLEPEAARELSAKLRQEVNVEVDDALELSLWASDSLISDPIAISVAPDGRIFYTSATRQSNSEFDVRGHRNWMTASISFQTVEDRREFLRKTFSVDSEESMAHLKDLNKDGVRDWRDLTVEKEQVWFITDESNDGIADRAQLYLEDFGEEITDVANGIEFHDGEVYIGVGPDLWRTVDEDQDGRADQTTSLAHGFAVHIGFSGHGMSGVTVGPLGRIWWGIGDIGMNVVDKSGKNWKYPNRGVVVRAEPDGSNFEVFAMGVRNTHEFVFDDYGNLISVDNDGDHRGERERLVYLIDGSDTGWRINWQFGKYSDPDNNTYKVWMDERLHLPRWEGQAAYILPTIQNYVNGPTGMVYNPGTALGPEWYHHFFVAEFRGSPSNSPVHAFTLKSNGAGFALDSTRAIVSGLLPTGLDFSADGSLYFGDWINGWGTKDAGRIWKLDVPGGAADPIRQETKALLLADFSEKPLPELGQLLGHQDQRVRRRAQFELVKRGNPGFDVLLAAAQSNEQQLGRIHGLWGIAQLARQDEDYAENLTPFLSDEDPEIIAQAARLIGDLRYGGAGTSLIQLLKHDAPRVKFFAMEALGRTEEKTAVGAILDLVRENNDQDTWLRAGSMIALGRIGDEEAVVALATDPSIAVRTAAVVALRRMESPGIADFLDDESEYVATEAARGINDDFSIEPALPDLAASLGNTSFTGEPFLRRAINANVRVGDQASIDRLVAYAAATDGPVAMRAEALAALASWGSPSVFDRVDGRYRGVITRDSLVAGERVMAVIDDLFADENLTLSLAAIHTAGRLGLTGTIGQLSEILTQAPRAETRRAALGALNALRAENLDVHLETALDDEDAAVRALALDILPESSISSVRAVTLYREVLGKGSVEEQQSALQGLGTIDDDEARKALKEAIGQLLSGKLSSEVVLDLIEAVETQDNERLTGELSRYADQQDPDLGLYAAALNGGDIRRGARIFYGNESAQCTRCHAVFEYGGNVGPGLAGVADRLTKKELLLSVIQPSYQLAAGYETVLVTLADSSATAGTVLDRNKDYLKLRIGKEDIQTIPREDIMEEESLPSSMPGVDGVLTKKQIRDLVAYLASLEAEES